MTFSAKCNRVGAIEGCLALSSDILNCIDCSHKIREIWIDMIFKNRKMAGCSFGVDWIVGCRLCLLAAFFWTERLMYVVTLLIDHDVIKEIIYKWPFVVFTGLIMSLPSQAYRYLYFSIDIYIIWWGLNLLPKAVIIDWIPAHSQKPNCIFYFVLLVRLCVVFLTDSYCNLKP